MAVVNQDDPAFIRHVVRSGEWQRDFCTCQTDENGARYFTCRRKACDDGRGQVCGGYCHDCFERLASLPERPEIVVLCGSTRFFDEFQRANYELTMAGKIVLSVGFYPHSQVEGGGHGEGVGHDSDEKVALDELHKRKIDAADRVLVLNRDGYIGESTRSEIEYAAWFEKPIDYLEPITRYGGVVR